jgi:hypothetical protein
VYRNNFFNYTNNNLLSNLLCDVSDDNKNVMVSELDLNISNSQSQTIQPEQPPPQRKILEKQNTEVDFKSQLQSNIIKILEKNIVYNSNNKNKNKKQNKNDKKSVSYKNTDENKFKNINNKKKEKKKNKNQNQNQTNENRKKITDINMANIKIIEKNNNYKVCLGTYEKNNISNSNKYLSKVNKRKIKNKYFVSSAKSRKSRGLKSPNINVHKVNSIISPNNKNNGNKKLYFNNYTKTDIGIKKYKTIFDNQKNSNQIDSVKYYNQIKQNKNPNTTSKKAIKSYIIYNHNLNNNKISPNNNHHCIYKMGQKSNNILLTNNSNNNCDNISTHQKKKTPSSKYKNLLNELHKSMSKQYQKKEEKINNSKANSHRNKKKSNLFNF